MIDFPNPGLSYQQKYPVRPTPYNSGIIPKSRVANPDHSHLSFVRLSTMVIERSDISITWEYSNRDLVGKCSNQRSWQVESS